jgi:hypothetical protein
MIYLVEKLEQNLELDSQGSRRGSRSPAAEASIRQRIVMSIVGEGRWLIGSTHAHAGFGLIRIASTRGGRGSSCGE